MARSNGDLIAKARQMALDVGRRPATRRRGARAAGRSRRGRPSDGRCRWTGVRVLDLSRLLPGGFCSLLLADFGADVLEGRGHGDGRLRALGAARLRGRRGLAPRARCSWRSTATSARCAWTSRARPAARCCCASSARTTSCSSPSARACWIASASAGTSCARRTRGSCTARSPATGRPGPTSGARGTTSTTSGLNGLLALTGERDGPPVQAGGQIADLGGGALMAAFGILAALRHRDAHRRGPGRRRLDVRRRAARGWRWSPGACSPRASVRGAAARRSAARSSATAPTPAPTAG